MPPKRSMKPRKSAPKAKKAYKKPKAKGGRRPAARRAAGGASKVVVRQQNLGQQTDSKVALSHGRPDSRASIMKAVSPLIHYIDTGSGTVTSDTVNGRQAWGSTQIASVQDLNDIGTYLSLNNPKPSASVAPSAYLLTKCEHNLKFSNVGQGNVRLSIIHCRAKRDIYTNMNYVDPNSNSYLWGTIVSAVQQGVEAAAGGATVGGTRYLIPGVDETESPIFTQYYQKVKTTEIYLAVGGTHTLQTHVKYDRVMNSTVYGNANLDSVMEATDFLLFKAEGQTGIIGTGEEERRVTIAQCQLAYTENWDYSFVQVQNARRYLTVTDPITATAETVYIVSGSTGSGVTATGLIE